MLHITSKHLLSKCFIVSLFFLTGLGALVYVGSNKIKHIYNWDLMSDNSLDQEERDYIDWGYEVTQQPSQGDHHSLDDDSLLKGLKLINPDIFNHIDLYEDIPPLVIEDTTLPLNLSIDEPSTTPTKKNKKKSSTLSKQSIKELRSQASLKHRIHIPIIQPIPSDKHKNIIYAYTLPLIDKPSNTGILTDYICFTRSKQDDTCVVHKLPWDNQSNSFFVKFSEYATQSHNSNISQEDFNNDIPQLLKIEVSSEMFLHLNLNQGSKIELRSKTNEKHGLFKTMFGIKDEKYYGISSYFLGQLTMINNDINLTQTTLPLNDQGRRSFSCSIKNIEDQYGDCDLVEIPKHILFPKTFSSDIEPPNPTLLKVGNYFLIKESKTHSLSRPKFIMAKDKANQEYHYEFTNIMPLLVIENDQHQTLFSIILGS